MNNFSDVIIAAKDCIGDKCRACPVCDGRGCRNKMPGPGSKGIGDTAIRNYDKWQNVRVVMDTFHENFEPDTSFGLWGKTFQYPFFAGPVGAVQLHYSDKYNDLTYNDVLVKACAENGIAAFTGDGTDPHVMEAAASALKNANGIGIPTVKPWDINTIKQKLALLDKSGCFAAAMDIDAAGLPFLQGLTPPAGSKSVADMREIISLSSVPFIIKGIMSVKGALRAKEAGASAIVVSNHGGRVLDQCPATVEVLPEIVEALGDSGMKVFVDGGIRTGTDVFKAIAMGADGVLIARPYVTAVYGGAEEGVKLLTQKIGKELYDTMKMCGAASLKDITSDMIRIF